jgi:hypothetical protein
MASQSDEFSEKEEEESNSGKWFFKQLINFWFYFVYRFRWFWFWRPEIREEQEEAEANGQVEWV